MRIFVSNSDQKKCEIKPQKFRFWSGGLTHNFQTFFLCGKRKITVLSNNSNLYFTFEIIEDMRTFPK